MLLRADADTAANTLAVYRRFGLFGNTETLRAALAAYAASRKTFTELLTEGEAALNAEDEAQAVALFTEAAGRRSEDPAPLYYLGMIAFRRKDYAGAQARYADALKKGADRALIQYARGMCAAAQGDIEGARKLLEEAANGGGDERYRKLARDLLKRM
jgi:Flp pilus assembly protein TadD